jgi:hypothetical protein
MNPRLSTIVSRYLALALLWLLVLAVLLASILLIHWGQIKSVWNPTVFILFILLWSLGSILASVRIVRNQGCSLLYCRRFGLDPAIEDRNKWFEGVLVEACRGLAVPVTLKDESISSPYSFAKGLIHVVTLMQGFLFLAPIVGVIRFYPKIFHTWSGFAFFSVGAIWLLIVLAITMIVRGWLHTSVGSRSSEEVRTLLRKVMKRRHSGMDLLVLRSTNARWQTHVEFILKEVTLAIIDITSETENINWETGRALDLLGPNRVLFVRGLAEKQSFKCVRSTLPDIKGDVLLMEWDQDPIRRERNRCVFVKALHDWVADGSTMSSIDASDYLETYERSIQQGKRRASTVYALIAIVPMSMYMVGGKVELVEAIFTCLASIVTYLVARIILTIPGLRITPKRAMWRGMAIAVGSYIVLFFPKWLYLVIKLILKPDPALVILLLMGMSLVPIGLAVTGAFLGLFVEYVFLRPKHY